MKSWSCVFLSEFLSNTSVWVILSQMSITVSAKNRLLMCHNSCKHYYGRPLKFPGGSRSLIYLDCDSRMPGCEWYKISRKSCDCANAVCKWENQSERVSGDEKEELGRVCEHESRVKCLQWYPSRLDLCLSSSNHVVIKTKASAAKIIIKKEMW